MSQGLLFPTTFLCQGCGALVIKKSSRDNRTLFCSPKCKLRGFYRRHIKQADRPCQRCGIALDRKGPLCRPCAVVALQERIKLRPAKPAKVHSVHPCVVCGCATSNKYRTCSKACWSVRHSQLLKGKKYRLARVVKHCRICHRSFVVTRRATVECPRCRKPKYLKSSYRRAKHFGVKRDRSISLAKVGTRDRWQCQLCGCRTLPKQRSTHDRYPNVDHIVPLSRGGTHTWDNVQLTCRSCNQRKATEIRGQFRLAI
jgi:5-methylcytosine-specific restriction endonuclease McrA